MPKDNEVDEKVMPEPLTYGMRRRGETAVIGLIPPKVHANPPKVPEYLRDYEEVPLYSAATVAELRAEVERLVKALDEAACELSAAGQALAEFKGFEFRQKAAIDRAYAASQKAHDANGYTEALAKVTP